MPNRAPLAWLSIWFCMASVSGASASARAEAAKSVWQQRSAVPYHVYGHASAELDGRIHLLGGCHTDDWQRPATKHQVYDPATDSWSTAAEVPRAVAWTMPAVLDGKLYLFGGGFYKPGRGLCATDEAWVYLPETDRWSRLPAMPEKRMNGCAVAVGDAIYISLGYNRQGGRDGDVLEEYVSAYRYNRIDGRYTRVTDSPETGCYVAAGAHDGLVYAVSGTHHEATDMDDRELADGALVYDPGANRWCRVRAPRVEKRVFYLTQCSASVVRDGRLYVVGGRTATGRTRVTSYLDLEARRFVRAPDLPEGRCCGGGAIGSGGLVIAGGFLGDVGRPAGETWTLALDAGAGPQGSNGKDCLGR